jgi:hypothetical protein
VVGVGVRRLRLGVAGFLEIELRRVGDASIVILAVTVLLCTQTLQLFHRVSLLAMEKITDLPVGFAIGE